MTLSKEATTVLLAGQLVGVEGGAAPRRSQGSTLKTSQNYTDHINGIPLKISSE
jgi:hypothetical protein